MFQSFLWLIGTPLTTHTPLGFLTLQNFNIHKKPIQHTGWKKKLSGQFLSCISSAGNLVFMRTFAAQDVTATFNSFIAPKKSHVLERVLLPVPLGNWRSQFRPKVALVTSTISRVGGRHFRAARFALISSTAVSLRITASVTMNQRPRTCYPRSVCCDTFSGGMFPKGFVQPATREVECERVNSGNEKGGAEASRSWKAQFGSGSISAASSHIHFPLNTVKWKY